jgi:DNA-directed RNA polymerase omega subunit
MVPESLENLLDKTGYSVYKLVNLASRRALEIAEGQPTLVQANPMVKPSNVALEEIRQGKVRLKKTKE